MRIGKLILMMATAGLLSSTLFPGPARADMSGDPDFCYVGWVSMPRYAYTEDEHGIVSQVRLSGSILVCPTDLR
jgi:hypothetical protein